MQICAAELKMGISFHLTLVVHLKLIGFADIALELIVIAPCDSASHSDNVGIASTQEVRFVVVVFLETNS